MIAIEDGDARDVAVVMQIMNAAFDPVYGEAWTAAQCIGLLALPDSRLLLARHGLAIAGFALSRWVLDEEELLMIGVDPTYQRKDIGATLLQNIILRAKQANRLKLFLEVRENNAAHLFYQSMGFSEVGRRRDYYSGATGAKFDAITMALAIQ
jgi:[ribosomal protein S18]-alanine N-acetyltransferase